MTQYKVLKKIYDYVGDCWQIGVKIPEDILDKYFSKDLIDILILDKFIELIPEQKYKVGDWVKLSSDNIKKISEIKNSIYYFDPYKYAFEEDIKCKVTPIKKTVYLYKHYEEYRISAGDYFGKPYNLIDQQEVTFWEEMKE